MEPHFSYRPTWRASIRDEWTPKFYYPRGYLKLKSGPGHRAFVQWRHHNFDNLLLWTQPIAIMIVKTFFEQPPHWCTCSCICEHVCIMYVYVCVYVYMYIAYMCMYVCVDMHVWLCVYMYIFSIYLFFIFCKFYNNATFYGNTTVVFPSTKRSLAEVMFSTAYVCAGGC